MRVDSHALSFNKSVDASSYFDNAATTPLDPRVREAMLPFLDEAFGNANSLHSLGMRSHAAVETARAQVAALIGAEDPSQIYFTGGATEANNWVLNAAGKIVTSPFEHSSMREAALARHAAILGNDGVRLRSYPNSEEQTLVSVMAVNNEVGTLWDVRKHAQPGDLLHADITQAVGKLPIELEGLDFASFSAHKFYGPKGVGALYCKDQPPPPLIFGGEQEHGYRGGTLNVAGIVGMGAAAEIAAAEREADHAKATALRQTLIDGLKGLEGVQISGGDRTSPYIVSVSFRGLEGETLVLEMDRAGYSISAGAACSSRSTEPNHVLTALKLESEWMRGTIRISFGRFNNEAAAHNLAKKLRSIVEMLRTL
jgi:cysteine desulfurase